MIDSVSQISADFHLLLHVPVSGGGSFAAFRRKLQETISCTSSHVAHALKHRPRF